MLEDDDGATPPPRRDRSALRTPPGRAQQRREEQPWSPTAWELLREGRWGLSTSAAAGGLVVVAGVVVLLVLGLGGGGSPVPTPSPGVAVPARGSATSSPTAPVAAAPADASSTGAASAPPGEVVVDVTGQVAHPGLVRLVPGARVDDALRAAGGVLETADLRRVNLARVLSDGEQLVVLAPGESPPAGEGDAVVTGAAGAGAGAAGRPAAGAASTSRTGPLDLNTATLADLDALPGVGPVLAQRVLDRRAAHGAFTSVDELAEVPGIGPTILARIGPLLRA